MNDCSECPISLSCWSGALLGKESSRIGYAKNVKDRAVWQESVTVCPVCEQLCIITYKHGEALEAFDAGLYSAPVQHTCDLLEQSLLRPGDGYFFRGAEVGRSVRKDGTGCTFSMKGLGDDTSSPLDGLDFTLERHHCPGRQLNEQGWAVWYNGFYQEGPLFVVREDDTAPSAHPNDHIWMKVCPLCMRAYLNKLSMDAKHEGLYLAPRSIVEFNTMHPTGDQLKDAIVATKADIIPGWKPYP